jgi:hypothetical protein
LWYAAGELNSKLAVAQVSRLECTPALRNKSVCPILMTLPLTPLYPVHLALIKSSQSLLHGPRLHNHLLRQPPNGLTEILMKALGGYNPDHDTFYLSLIKQSGGSDITPDLRRMAARIICEALAELAAESRKEDWVSRAIGWLGRLDSEFSLPMLNLVCNQKKFFFFKAWPDECRQLAGDILMAAQSGPDAKDGR